MGASPQLAPKDRESHVLVAADDITLSHIHLLLSKSGYAVVPVRDGAQALSTLQSEDAPTLAVLDGTLPGISGAEICRRIRSTGQRSLYIILLTRWNQQNERVEGLEAGADDCLYKPVDIRELRIRLQTGSQFILERALRESEDRFKSAFNAASIGMALTSPSGKILQINQAFCNFLGFNANELTGTTLEPLHHPGTLSLQDLIGTLMAGYPASSELERRFLTRQGKVAWGAVTVSLVHDADLKPSAVLVQLRDITERRHTEEALHRSEAFANAIAKNASDLIMILRQQHEILYASPSFLPILGYKPEDLSGTDIRKFIHSEDQQFMSHAAEILLANENPSAVFVMRLRHNSGNWRSVEIKGTLTRGVGDGENALLMVGRTIDERLEAERKLQEAHSQTELFLQYIPSILIGLDAEGNILRWNTTAAKVFGLTSEQVLNRDINNCGIQWAHPDMPAEISRWLTTETSYRSEGIGYQSGKEARFVGLHVQRVSEATEIKLRYIVTGADITARRQLEEQLRQAQKLEAIGQLSAGVAHEINTPMQFIGDNAKFLQESWPGIAQLLELGRKIRRLSINGNVPSEMWTSLDQCCEKTDLDYLLTEVPSAIEQSLEGIQRVASIVRAMKEFSHPGSEDKRAIDLNHTIETTVTVAKGEWKYVADVITNFDRSLPPVLCHAGEINQVILNLLVNAVHAIAALKKDGASAKGKIILKTRRDGDWAEISITDTGGGIPPEIHSRIFEPFFTTKPVGQGTGQGLALVHSVVVKRHHGQIRFETTEGRGTTFFVRIPFGEAPPE